MLIEKISFLLLFKSYRCSQGGEWELDRIVSDCDRILALSRETLTLLKLDIQSIIFVVFPHLNIHKFGESKPVIVPSKSTMDLICSS